jgi:hypothetical protein
MRPGNSSTWPRSSISFGASNAWIVVRAYFEPELGGGDPDLFAFDSRHEITRLPVELLSGPGGSIDAVKWFVANQPQPDEVDPLDRTYLVRHDDGHLWLPMRPEIVSALPVAERSGTWFAIVADDPMTAWRLVSNLVGGAGCDRADPCIGCGVQTKLVGDYAAVVAICPPAAGARPTGIRTPRAHPRSREV